MDTVYALIAATWLTFMVSAVAEAQNEPIPARPLTELCQPLGVIDELKLKFDPDEYWRSKITILRQYKNATSKFLKIAPIEMQREIRNIQSEIMKDRALMPEMYSGDMAKITQQLDAENLIATRDLWVMMIQDARRDIAWANKCLGIADKKYQN